jgi:hypothetical protein
MKGTPCTRAAHGSSIDVRDTIRARIKKRFSILIDLLIISKIYISLISITRARGAHARARAVVAAAGHDGRMYVCCLLAQSINRSSELLYRL